MTPFELSERLVEDMIELNPLVATHLGLPGRNHLWPDMGMEGVEANAELIRRYLSEFSVHLEHEDPWQRLAAVVAHDYLSELDRAHEARDYFYDVSHMACSFDAARAAFDIMPTGDQRAWEDICVRLESLGVAFAGYQDKLRAGVEAGMVSAKRQVSSVIHQADELAGEGSALLQLAERAAKGGFGDIAERLGEAIRTARRASGELATFLRTQYLPHAPEEDGVGEERYRRAADGFLGLDIDPREVYDWGWRELRRIRIEMERVSQEIEPGASVDEVARLLETDPERQAPNRAAFVDFVLDRQRKAVADLDGPHFDVPDEIRDVTVQIAPPGGALGAYYVPPTEDFTTRKGGIWYSMAPEDGPIPLYQEVSTAYHEGFPGHHLQVALVMTMRDRLSRFHRSLLWYSGFGEGWALYTERLMNELGYFEKPDYVFGMLATHVFRASRVVVDIGCHLGYAIPDDAPLHAGEPWNFETAVDFMHEVGMQPHDYAESEVQRYLGWPGQAISYKVGEREILSLREEVEQREGDDFSLKDFHHRVLGHGEMRLERLRQIVLEGWE
jgi:uncharacterized protein (DUF885 family)